MHSSGIDCDIEMFWYLFDVTNFLLARLQRSVGVVTGSGLPLIK